MSILHEVNVGVKIGKWQGSMNTFHQRRSFYFSVSVVVYIIARQEKRTSTMTLFSFLDWKSSQRGSVGRNRSSFAKYRS